MYYGIQEQRAILDRIRSVGKTFWGDWIEYSVEAFCTHTLRKGDSAVDVGAHRGRHTIPMAKKVGPSGRIYAVEAASRTAEKLRAALNHSDVPHARKITQVFELAVSDAPGEADFTYIPEAAGLSGLRSQDLVQKFPEAKVERVKVDLLDNIIPAGDQKIRCIKLDIEGAEFSALRGASNILRRCRPFLTLEHGGVHRMKIYDYTPDDYFGFFRQEEYSIYTPFGGIFDRSWIDGKQPSQLFAIPNEKREALTDLLAPAMIQALALLATSAATAASPREQ